MDTTTCQNCMSPYKVFIPREVQLLESQKERRVSKAAFFFLSEFRFVKIDKKNPILKLKPELREALVLRRMVHKMFDMLICDEWTNLFQGQFKGYEFLILRDCFLTFDMISKPRILIEDLKPLYFHLQNHLRTCKKCDYVNEMCKICRDNKRLIVRYQVDKVARCNLCRKIGHKECVSKAHECSYAPND